MAELSEAEQRVWDAFGVGMPVDLRTGEQEKDTPKGGQFWGPERTVRASVLKTLLLEGRAAEPGQVARLSLTGARIVGPLDLTDAEIDVTLELTECHFDQEVTVANARTRRLDFSGSSLPGLHARQARIDGDLVLRHCEIPAGIRLAGAQLAGILLLNYARLGASNGYALHAARMVIDHSIYCAHFEAAGGIYLVGARIGGGLHMLDARVTSRERDALEASRTTIQDDCNLVEGCRVDGAIRFVQAHVHGRLNLSGAHLDNPDGPAVIADNLRVDQNLYCANLTANAEFRLLGAHIAGDFVLSGAHLNNAGGHAVDGGSLVVERGLRCDEGFVADGGLRLIGSHVNVFELLPAKEITGDIDLRYARFGLLRDDVSSISGTVQLDGSVYDALDPLLSVPDRLKWLARQPDGYRPLPYEQLATTYRRLGHDADARRVLLAKQRRRRKTLSVAAKAWGLLQDWTVGYGYLPGRAALWLLTLLAVGTALFWLDPPSQVQNGTRFNAFFYALDVIVPVLKLGQQNAFTPSGTTQWLAYLLTIMGWVLATTVATGISRTITRN
ncbi:hypothetical protein SacmaDRAFT_0432 [Saccharomonospora marina XMU15]|uniref:Membrane-associated oxidoreductase n=1 Tax=Saccharomonospora marina XMU15 TaxID=882083 RepID=H5X2D6_9PSEU|nr:hypothetical protein [Saccharomonospora marina]EHR48735.1 hypothetical protein SacmaDRAFT_0432 [Saccharomonospora marina XMU15]